MCRLWFKCPNRLRGLLVSPFLRATLRPSRFGRGMHAHPNLKTMSSQFWYKQAASEKAKHSHTVDGRDPELRPKAKHAVTLIKIARCCKIAFINPTIEAWRSPRLIIRLSWSFRNPPDRQQDSIPVFHHALY